MRYAVAEGDLVRLKDGNSPLPEGAVEPVLNWDAIINLKPWYLKIVENEVVVKTQAEKDAADDARLPDYKVAKKGEIDAKTSDLILKGFTYDGNEFSMSDHAQINWADLMVAGTAELLTYPVAISTDDNGTYDITDLDHLKAFFTAMLTRKEWCLSSGRDLKDEVDACTDIQELFAIHDDRT